MSKMLKTRIGEAIACVVLWILVIGAAEKCAYRISFPTLSGSVFMAQENTEISLPFTLNFSCGVPDKYRITVAKRIAHTSILATVCLITYRTDTCYTSTDNCKCLSTKTEYALNKIVTRTDSETWIWYMDKDEENGTEILFNITGDTGVVNGASQSNSLSYSVGVAAVSIASVLAAHMVGNWEAKKTDSHSGTKRLSKKVKQRCR